ncbi:CCDC90 family protein [Hydrogenobaculum acidophilum]
MSTNIPVSLYEKLTEKFGKETALEIVEVLEDTTEYLEDRVLEETKKRKLELRDELRKELATKEDVLLVRQEIETVRQEIETVRQELKGEINSVREELKGEINSLRQEIKGEIKVMKMWIFFLGVLIVFLNQNTLAFIGKIILSIFK